MKVLLTVIFVLVALAGVKAQEMTKERRNEAFKREISRADWVLAAKDENGIPYYVDSLTMKRFVNTVVVFLVKSEKKESIEYTKNIGGCTKHIVATDNRMFSKPGGESLTGGAVDQAEHVVLAKGTIDYSILEYVCKNAKELKLNE
jgi:hypothetical protein